MKKNFLRVRQQPRENVISRPAADAMNSTSSIPKSGRRGDRSQVQILSPQMPEFLGALNFLPHLLLVLVLAAAGPAGRNRLHLLPAGSGGQTANPPAADTAAPSPSATVPIEPPSLIPPNILPAPDSLPQIPATAGVGAAQRIFQGNFPGKSGRRISASPPDGRTGNADSQ